MDIYVHETSKDIFTVYTDVVGGVTTPVPVKAGEDPPETAWPNTFIGWGAVQQAYRGHNIIRISALPPENTKRAREPSEAELNQAISQFGLAPQPATPLPLSPSGPLPALGPDGVQARLLLLFQQYLNEFNGVTRQKREIARAYCNGIAQAALMIYPDLESKLRELIAGVRERKEML